MVSACPLAAEKGSLRVSMRQRIVVIRNRSQAMPRENSMFCPHSHQGRHESIRWGAVGLTSSVPVSGYPNNVSESYEAGQVPVSGSGGDARLSGGSKNGL